jgi:enediyne biosynthesis protein E3
MIQLGGDFGARHRFQFMFSFLRPLLRIDPREAEFSRRGFVCSRTEIRDRLEYVGKMFLLGYHVALEEENPVALAARLDHIAAEYRGFAYEGAAMSLALLDKLSLRSTRFSKFLTGTGKRHIYMLHVGAGWTYARLPWLRWRMETAIRHLDPVLRWLVIDGYGFHQGYFHWRTATLPNAIPAQLSEHARHVYFQGLGRSLWFVKGSDPLRISETIARFDSQYHNDLWSGAGLACAYAGGVSQSEIQDLRRRAGAHSAALAQGAAFAAKTRLFAGNPARHTETACAILCGIDAEQAAALCDVTLQRVNRHHDCPYQQWRFLLQKELSRIAEIMTERIS